MTMRRSPGVIPPLPTCAGTPSPSSAACWAGWKPCAKASPTAKLSTTRRNSCPAAASARCGRDDGGSRAGSLSLYIFSLALRRWRRFHAHEEFAIGRSGGNQRYGHGFNPSQRSGGRLDGGCVQGPSRKVRAVINFVGEAGIRCPGVFEDAGGLVGSLVAAVLVKAMAKVPLAQVP